MGFGIALTLSVLVPLFIVIGVIAGIIVLIQRSRNNQPASKTPLTEKEGEEVLKNIYVYLVLFATLMMSIGGAVGVVVNLADVIAPSANISTYDQYRTQQLREMEINSGVQIIDPNDLLNGSKIEEDIQYRYDQMKEEAIQHERTTAVRRIIQSLAWVIIPLPVFIFFQRQRNRETKQTT